MAGGFSGLLSGLKAAAGRGLAGAGTTLFGTPNFALSGGGSIAASPGGPGAPPTDGGLLQSIEQDIGPPAVEALQRAPTNITPTGENTGGLLSGFMNTGEDGITVNDRLFALGSILQGDSQGAGNFLGSQRSAAAANAASQRKLEMERAGLDAMNRAFRPDGSFDMNAYITAARELGVDPSAGLGMAKALAPESSIMTPSGGGVVEVRRGPFGGAATLNQLQAPPPKEAEIPRVIRGPDGQPIPNPAYARMLGIEAGAKHVGGGKGGAKPTIYSRIPTAQLRAMLVGQKPGG